MCCDYFIEAINSINYRDCGPFDDELNLLYCVEHCFECQKGQKAYATKESDWLKRSVRSHYIKKVFSRYFLEL